MTFKIPIIITVLVCLSFSIGCGPKITDGEMFAEANQHQREGKYDEAISTYNKLIDTYPASPYGPQARFMIGFIYANEMKDIENARKSYEKFLEIYPDHEMAKDARWELDHLGEDINDIETLTQENIEEKTQE